jgi:hypothetical protein
MNINIINNNKNIIINNNKKNNIGDNNNIKTKIMSNESIRGTNIRIENMNNNIKFSEIIHCLKNLKLLMNNFLEKNEVEKIKKKLKKNKIYMEIISYFSTILEDEEKVNFIENIFTPYMEKTSNIKKNNNYLSELFGNILTGLTNKNIKNITAGNYDYMDSIDSVHNRMFKTREAAEKYLSDYLANTQKMMNDLFESFIIEQNESKSFTTKKIIKDYSFNLDTIKLNENRATYDLYVLFDDYFGNGNDKYANDKKKYIYKLSKILIIFINKGNKRNQIKINEIIDMKNYCNTDFSYNLVTVINYDNKRNYNIIYKNKNNNNYWTILPQNIQCQNLNDVLNYDFYILFYLAE